MDTSTQPTTVRLELFVRSLAPNGVRPAQESVVERLQRLESTGQVESLTLYITGEQGCRSAATARTDAGQFLLDRVDGFWAWADRSDRSITPFFRLTETARGIDRSDCSGIRYPAIALAEYEDGELRFVAPSAGEEATTVLQRAARLGREYEGGCATHTIGE